MLSFGDHVPNDDSGRKKDKTEPGKEFGDFECGQVTGDERKIKDKQYIQVRKDGTDSYGYIEALDTLVRALKMYIK